MLLKSEIIITCIAIFAITCSFLSCTGRGNTKGPTASISDPSVFNKPKWLIPDTAGLGNTREGELIKYGRDLIVNTSHYFGPKGIVAAKSNGLNCQNCHLDAGTRLFGNNFSLVATSYPKYKERSGTVETVVKKVQDCFERSLNGKIIDPGSREMKAFVAYLKWVGKNVSKGTRPQGAGIEELPFLDRAADPALGKLVYEKKCRSCHGQNGEGVLSTAGTAYAYPALWGAHSYNIGASIFRISKMAGFVKNNMPFGASQSKQQLSNEEAWDVAAFINSQPRPYKNTEVDWPDLATKPFDHPFGPYPESLFDQAQHKYGPYAPIKNHYTLLTKRK